MPDTSIETALRDNLAALNDEIDGHREARHAITAALDALRTADTATARDRIDDALAALDNVL